eukprot:TRINITY_DN59047_c0_g1_i1.p1 TRINITY_DN59047_c0_g1~~TRINITY_DN59047_c0_g1_i1.p1  ORF type:complete len:547 (-),score=125.65 TRINITY_DN59047_c0_g1_i1:250-1839(-)
MDSSWFSKKAEELAQAAQLQVKELQESASKFSPADLAALAERQASQFISTQDKSRKDLKFLDGPLGFSLDCGIVTDLEPGLQAALLGVEVGDRLVAVDGFEVPRCKDSDVAGQDKNNRKIRKWLKEMPRPGRLLFEPPSGSKSISQEESMADLAAVAANVSTVAAPPPIEGDGDAAKTENSEVPEKAAAAVAISMASTHGSHGRDPQQLRAELEELRAALAETQANLEAEKRKSQKFLDELGRARSRNNELLESSSTQKVEKEGAVDALQSQVTGLSEDLARVTEELKDAKSRASSAEERAAQAEETFQSLTEQLGGFQAVHDAEIELLREEHGRQSAAAHAEHRGREQQVQLQLQEAQQCAEELRRQAHDRERAGEAAIDDARAAAVEAADARRACQEAKGEAQVLQSRVQALEKQCALLQEKLSSRLLSTGASAGRAGGGQSHPVWLPVVQKLAGPRIGALSLNFYSIPDRALRMFTERMLEHNTLLWFFYLHVLFLYLIAVCWYIRTDDPGRQVDNINVKLNAGGH